MMFILFEGVAFNCDSIQKKDFKDWYEHEKHHGIDKKKMKELYDLIKNNLFSGMQFSLTGG